MYYFVKTPWLLKKIYPSYVWHVNTNDRKLFLTFDDGPHPTVTPFVLQQLNQFNALATFFCIGKNVLSHPNVYEQILGAGHSVGNHTHDHLNGWKTDNETYMLNVAKASAVIDSKWFRPPYGRVRSSQAKQMRTALKNKEAQLLMWDVLSGDFDVSLSKEKCLDNVIKNSRQGSIIVFHDSEKAFPRLEYALPRTLEFFAEKGYQFCKL